MREFKHVLTLCLLLAVGSLLVPNTNAQTCCVLRGDVDGSSAVNVSDLTYLVAFLFQGGPGAPCAEEADVDASGAINVSDLTFLVAFLFQGGDAPPDCPASPEVVFVDDYGNTVTYQAFGGSLLDAVQISTDSMYAGTQGLEITIPDVGNPAGSYSGGAFTADPRDLTAYNALTFWAKASTAATLDVAGIGNDNTGTSVYTAQMGGLALTTSWQKYTIPFPLAEKLDAEGGMFFFAEGPEGGLGYQIWMDEIIFENLGTITNPRPDIGAQSIEVGIGEAVLPGNGTVIFDVDGTDVTVSAMAGYFTFTSSDEGVVSVAGDGTISAVSQGSATLTAKLGLVDATGTVTVTVTGPEAVPTTGATAPTQDPGDVISLFSDVYTDVPVNTWSADWDNADVADYVIGGTDNTKKYTNLVFAGIEFTTPTVDASAMTHFRIDVWTPEDVTGKEFRVKLVDFGPNGTYDGGDDSFHELVYTDATMISESWVSLDVPLASMTGLAEVGHLAQLVISGTIGTVYVDNIFFYDSGVPTEPLTAAPVPTPDPGNVVSLYSDTYTPGATVDTWSAVWDVADVEDFVIGTDSSKKYTNLSYAGIEFTGTLLDASAMTRFHMDVWTPFPTGGGAVFKVKLVDAGADGVVGTGGDDSEQELSFGTPPMATGSWVSIDIPLTDFTGLAGTANLAQMIISGDFGTVYVDNIFFYVPAPTEPTVSATAPTADPGDVISIFSDAYTNISVDTWSSPYDVADVADFTIGSDNLKLYTGLSYAIIEFTTTTQDVSGMTHFHMDVWTPDSPSYNFMVKLVDFGANGVWDAAGDDVEHELTFDGTTMSTGTWVSIDVPMTDFAGLTTQQHLAQLIISGVPNTVFVDNIYFYDAGTPTEPTVSATAPTVPAVDVISIFSDVYTNISVDTWSSPYDVADVADFTIGSDNLKQYTGLSYAIIEFTTTTQDVSTMTHFHLDVWTPDSPANDFKVKLVDFGPNGVWNAPGGDDVEHELTFDGTTMSTGTWVSLEIPMSAFTGLTTQQHVAQLIISGDPNTVFVDNIYFHK